MNEFEQRLAHHYDEHYFCSMLRKCWSERNELLRELDDARISDPEWYAGNDIIGMMMYTECFAKNLQGVKSHLDYIQECGVNYLHLMPLLDTPKGKSDGGYAVSNFRKVRPDLGTMEDLAELAAKCHSLGISVCLDFVMNHTSSGQIFLF